MVICVKCGKEQGRRSSSVCTNEGMDDTSPAPLPDHSWMDRSEFIDELREKLPPFILVLAYSDKFSRSLAELVKKCPSQCGHKIVEKREIGDSDDERVCNEIIALL